MGLFLHLYMLLSLSEIWGLHNCNLPFRSAPHFIPPSFSIPHPTKNKTKLLSSVRFVCFHYLSVWSYTGFGPQCHYQYNRGWASWPPRFPPTMVAPLPPSASLSPIRPSKANSALQQFTQWSLKTYKCDQTQPYIDI